MKAVLISAAMVGVGGFVGAILRFGLSGYIHRNATTLTFPLGTLAVNMLGCLMIGVAVGLLDGRHVISPELRSFVLVGLLGGFTTYSTFGLETFALAKDGDYLRAFANVAIHVVLGLTLVWGGYTLTAR